jgi:hypothetical protein
MIQGRNGHTLHPSYPRQGHIHGCRQGHGGVMGIPYTPHTPHTPDAGADTADKGSGGMGSGSV